MTKHRVLSGIRATGRLHLGNYFGAVKGMLALQDDPNYETFYMVADAHTITTPYQVEELRKNRREVVLDYLAAGLDPEKSVIFLQSDVKEHFELAFYFSAVTTVAKMQHLPTFKDKVKQHPDNVTMALLNYPLLMAADILLYKATAVPVGIDQEPHIEVTREIARRFNQDFGTTFPEPIRYELKHEYRYIPSLTGVGKMSKSVENSYINLTDDLETITQRISKIPTDSGVGSLIAEPEPTSTEDYQTYSDKQTTQSAGVASLFALVEIFEGTEKHDHYQKLYTTTGVRYGDLKAELAQAIFEYLQPIQQKRAELEAQPEYLNTVISDGAAKASQVAQETIAEVRQHIGLL